MDSEPSERPGADHINSSVEVSCMDAVIIGAGQAGLAMSRCLVDCNVKHVVLEKGRLVERWKSERWDSLRLLTPNWMTRLPGNYQYNGNDPDGFMTVQETIEFFEKYAKSFGAPVKTHTEVTRVERIEPRDEDKALSVFRVVTNRGTEYHARNVVIATGFCHHTRVFHNADKLPSNIVQLGPSDYRRPSQLPPGNVLIVGASATGCQIAEELLNYNQTRHADYFDQITISVGRHTRLPRRYRGKDILSWLYEIGYFSSPCEALHEREAPGPQLIGTPEHRDLDLEILQSRGVQLVGHAIGLKEGNDVLEFRDDLYEHLTAADAKLNALLQTIDAFIEGNVMDVSPATNSITPVPCPPSPPTKMALTDICTVIWATGFVRSYPWLYIPNILDEGGDICHTHGVTAEPGVYVLGMRFQRTRTSNFIDGVGADAQELANHIVARAKQVTTPQGD